VVPSKNVHDSRRSDLLAFLGNRSQREGTRKSGSLEKSAAVPCEPDFPGCLWGDGLGPGAGIRKVVPSKKVSHLWWSLTPGPRSEQRVMGKSGSVKKMCRGKLFIAELEGLRTSP
jgi:hypothetical protein